MLITALIFSSISKISSVTDTQWLIFFLIAITTGGAAIFLYYYGLKKVTASVATICELAFPLTAVILEYFLHGNMLDIVQWIGVTILLTSIIKVSSLNNK
jgi:drug/metabolite transporter (DMT)-like permease